LFSSPFYLFLIVYLTLFSLISAAVMEVVTSALEDIRPKQASFNSNIRLML
jgi:hypothetical protein